MKNKNIILCSTFSVSLLMIFCFSLNGCIPYCVNDAELSNPPPEKLIQGTSIQPPEKKSAEPVKIRIEQPVDTEKEIIKKSPPPTVPVPAPPQKTKPRAAEENTAEKQPANDPRSQKSPRSPEKFRRGPGMWRAFTRLSADEQRELLKLQRTDPDRYREIMQNKADQLYAQEKARRIELEELVKQYHTASVQAEKDLLKAELRRKLKEDFQQRLQDTSLDIESYKRRTAHLEEELRKREQNCDAIVDAILSDHLNKKTVIQHKKE